MTQVQTLIKHFKKGGKITSLEATVHFGITQLAARIKDIENKHGYIVKKKPVHKNKKRFIQYSYD